MLCSAASTPDLSGLPRGGRRIEQSDPAPNPIVLSHAAHGASGFSASDVAEHKKFSFAEFVSEVAQIIAIAQPEAAKRVIDVGIDLHFAAATFVELGFRLHAFECTRAASPRSSWRPTGAVRVDARLAR